MQLSPHHDAPGNSKTHMLGLSSSGLCLTPSTKVLVATHCLHTQAAKEPRASGGQAPEQPRNGKAVGDGKPRGLEGDWRAAKEKPAGDQDAPEGESQPERMRREFEEERQRLQEQRKKGGHTAQRAANVSTL